MSWIELYESGTLGTILVGMAAGTCCAIVGCFLVLRRMGLLGDAISHAVLPGLVIGFMWSGTRELWPMLIGAAAAGLLTTYLTELLGRRARVEHNAGMGVVFTSLFALGVILLHLYHDRVDLDPGCVLYGQIGTVALDTFPWLGFEIPRALVSLGVVGLVLSGLVTLLWKELKITSFDPALATTLGISAGVVHYLLMTLVACTTVACFESVGSILVIAMLIVPASTAHLLTDRLAPLILIAVLVSWISAIGGGLLAASWDVSEGGMIAVFGGAQLGLAVFLSPRYGLVPRWGRRAGLALRILREDILARLYRLTEQSPDTADQDWEQSGVPAGALRRRLALRLLSWQGYIRQGSRGLRLTPRGLTRARALVRSHRVWESFLREKFRLPLDHLHEPAHRMEHFVDESMTEAILERLDRPAEDPHGREIPTREEP